MTERDDCIDDIARRTGRSRRDVEDELDAILSRAEGRQRSGESPREALGRAAQEMLDEEARMRAIRRRNVHMDALKQRDLFRFADAVLAKPELAGDAARLAAEAPLVGVNTPLFDPKSRLGNQRSAGALGLGNKVDWVGGAVNDMRAAEKADPAMTGLDRLFFSRRIEDDIFLEKYELDRGARGNPGVTKNPQALKIAEILNRWDRVRIDTLNAEGAWIQDYAGHMVRVAHDPDRLRKASNQRAFRRGFTEEDRLAWVAKTLPRLDTKRTFGGQEADKALAEMWGGLVTGDHLETALTQDPPIIPNVARQVSEVREFHWKSGADMLAYLHEFGRFNPTDAWLHAMVQDADRAGLMKVYGSRPKEGFEQHLAYLKNKTMGTPARVALDKWEQALRNRFDVVSGAANRPVANMWSGVVNGVMAVQRMAKLGLTPFAMLQDNITISRELARQGVGAFDRYAPMLGDYFRGAEGSEKRQVADLLHTGILERLQGSTARWDIGDAQHGFAAKMENLFFKITGITPMTANKRAGAERMMAKHLGDQRGKTWGDLGAEETRMLEAFGIGDKEWDLLGRTEWNTIDGTTYLTPDVAQRLPDAAVGEYLRNRGTVTDRLAVGGAPDALAQARKDLSLKLWSYFAERGNFAVLEVGPRERAMLYQGTRPGTPLNLALRLLMQFKQFPTAMVTKAWGADVYGGAKGLNRITGLTELIVGSTLTGMLANYLNSVAKGQDPNATLKNQPAQAIISGFLRGGAASIYGDFLLGEWSRFGLSAAATVLGPSLGQIDRAAELWTDITHPEWLVGRQHARSERQTGALLVRSARENTPFANMIYTKAAVDYLVMYRLQEWLNPGYLARMEQRMKDQSGVEFLVRPSQVVRH